VIIQGSHRGPWSYREEEVIMEDALDWVYDREPVCSADEFIDEFGHELLEQLLDEVKITAVDGYLYTTEV
jgi:hypothetical protein